MNLGLTGKKAVVTGASRGIGNAIARRLIREGAQVATCARDADELRQSVEELGGNDVCWAAPCDIGDKDAYDSWLHSAVGAMGGCDLFVSNASALAVGDEEGDWSASFEVDLMGAVRGSRMLAPIMAEAGKGAIVLVSSVAALELFVMPAAYNALKAAMITYASQLSELLAARNIRVNCISPGAIEFPGGFWSRARREMPELYEATIAKQPTGRLGTVEEVADCVAFLLSDRASWISGENLVIDGGYTKRVAF
jgi:NAD(P)-dependent dehydrogenase (short-subunit alcohol dehydrogenase family)